MGVCPSSSLVGRESEFRIRDAVPWVGDAVGRPTRRRERRRAAPPDDGDEYWARGVTGFSPLTTAVVHFNLSIVHGKAA